MQRYSPPGRSNQPPPPTYRYTRQFLQQEVGTVRRATWGPRAVAALADFAIVAVPLNLIINLFYWVQHTFTASNATDAANSTEVFISVPFWLQMLVWMLLFSLYAVVSTARRGATIGKRWMNLRVVTDDGQPPARRDLLIRYSFIYICNLPLLVYAVIGLVLGVGISLYLAVLALVIDFGLGIFDPRGKTLHDQLAHTQVVIADLRRI